MIITALLVLSYFNIYPENAHTPIPFLGILWIISLIVAHMGLAYYIWGHARRCSNRFMGIPPWVWVTVAFAMGILGVASYWFANCSRTIAKETLDQ